MEPHASHMTEIIMALATLATLLVKAFADYKGLKTVKAKIEENTTVNADALIVANNHNEKIVKANQVAVQTNQVAVETAAELMIELREVRRIAEECRNYEATRLAKEKAANAPRS